MPRVPKATSQRFVQARKNPIVRPEALKANLSAVSKPEEHPVAPPEAPPEARPKSIPLSAVIQPIAHGAFIVRVDETIRKRAPRQALIQHVAARARDGITATLAVAAVGRRVDQADPGRARVLEEEGLAAGFAEAPAIGHIDPHAADAGAVGVGAELRPVGVDGGGAEGGEGVVEGVVEEGGGGGGEGGGEGGVEQDGEGQDDVEGEHCGGEG